MLCPCARVSSSAGTAASAGALLVVTGAVYALDPVAPVLSLGVLYLFAVLPVAAFFGLRFAVVVSVVSMLTFNYLFLPPRHTFHLAESEDWVALAVYLVVAVSVSALAARARRRAAEAEQQRREASFAAEVSALLLGQPSVESLLPEIAVRTADLLGVSHCWIELGSTRAPELDEQARDLEAGGRYLGRIYFDAARPPGEGLTARVLAVLASLLAAAIEREELSRSDATKTAVLRSVSHDLRSPLTAIASASEMLADPDELLRPATASSCSRRSASRRGGSIASSRTCSTSATRGRRRQPRHRALERRRARRPVAGGARSDGDRVVVVASG